MIPSKLRTSKLSSRNNRRKRGFPRNDATTSPSSVSATTGHAPTLTPLAFSTVLTRRNPHSQTLPQRIVPHANNKECKHSCPMRRNPLHPMVEKGSASRCDVHVFNKTQRPARRKASGLFLHLAITSIFPSPFPNPRVNFACRSQEGIVGSVHGISNLSVSREETRNALPSSRSDWSLGAGMVAHRHRRRRGRGSCLLATEDPEEEAPEQRYSHGSGLGVGRHHLFV